MGIKFIETASGREYGYCMHTFFDFGDIALNATLIFAKFWYRLPGHAAIEMIFKLYDKYLIVVNYGLHKMRFGLVGCRQMYTGDIEAGAKYLAVRSYRYRVLLKVNIIGNKTNYHDVINGPVKAVNDFYVRHKWIPADFSTGKIRLNHGCLWYVFNLFSRLSGISVNALLTNPNISEPIVRFDDYYK